MQADAGEQIVERGAGGGGFGEGAGGGGGFELGAQAGDFGFVKGDVGVGEGGLLGPGEFAGDEIGDAG